MKLQALVEPYFQDFVTLLDATGLSVSEQNGGKTGLRFMYELLHAARSNRSYDDSHPGFASGRWKRILPYDGSGYCHYYEPPFNGNDSTVETLLRVLKKRLIERESNQSRA